MAEDILIKRCLQCHEGLPLPARQQQKFCNNFCRVEYKRINGRKYYCAVCGKEFGYKEAQIRPRTCSDECSLKLREAYKQSCRVEIACDYCHKKFQKQRSILHKINFCDMECFRQYKKISEKGALNPNWKGGVPPITCQQCGKIFVIKKRGGIEEKVRFCSLLCWCTYRTEHHLLTGRPRYRQGIRPDLKQAFRSSWEANIARTMRLLNIPYVYEPQTFYFPDVQRGPKSYLPDFYLSDDKVYLEIKGWMDTESRMKLQCMEKYYPGIDIIVMMNKSYRAIEDEYGWQIPEWEWETNTKTEVAQIKREVYEMFDKKINISRNFNFKHRFVSYFINWFEGRIIISEIFSW